MVILVTGGAGFIGSNFVDHLLEHSEDQVVCLDALTYAGCLDNLNRAMVNPRFRFVCGDIRKAEDVESVFQQFHPQAVVNFAAESHVDRSLTAPLLFLETNVTGTGVLLEACRRFGGVRFHQISTDEVYGDLPLDRPELLFTEESPLRPSSPYSASKASADLLVLSYFRTYGLPVTVSRCSNNYGPRQHPEKLIPKVIRLALADEKLPIYGSGRQVRDWIAVEDHCQAVNLILRRGQPGQIYNIGASTEVSNLQLVRHILRRLGKPETLIQNVADRPGHDLRYGLDWGKLRDQLGWKPSITFAEEFARTVDWYLSHGEPQQNV